MQDLILFPCNGNARETLAVIEAINRHEPTWNVLGFVDDDVTKKGRTVLGHPILGGRQFLQQYPQARVIAVPGRPETHAVRDQIINLLDIPMNRFVTLIDPSVSVGCGVTIGVNTVIMAGVVLTCQVRVGNHCVILPNSVLAHEVTVKDYCLIGSNVSVSGNVLIEPLVYIGTGSRIAQEITVGQGSLIGMGAVVLKTVPEREVWVGCPARFLRRNA